jgi:hypothetical protein
VSGAAGLVLLQVIFRGAIAIAVWYALSYGLSGRQDSPVKNGRRVAAWLAAWAVFATPQTPNRTAEDVAHAIMITAPVWYLVWYLCGFVAGYVWRKLLPLSATGIGSLARTPIQADALIQRVVPERRHRAAARTGFDGNDRRTGLWARVYAEAQGNETVANANYLKLRAAELRDERTGNL